MMLSKNKRVTAGVLAAAALGAAAGILLTPRSGRQTQHFLSTKVLRAGRAVRTFRKKSCETATAKA